MRHGIRIAIIWVVASVLVDGLIGIIPIPSPIGSPEGLGEHQTVYMLFYVGAPIFVFVWILFLYNLIVFRGRAGEDVVDHPAPPDSNPILLLWAGLSFVIVLFLAGWGTFTLHEITSPPRASASVTTSSTPHGQTSKAAAQRPVPALTIQVIGQQWAWTFRYPSYGGMETRDLVVPVNTPIHLSITSLDVVHSLWIYDYDIKEDAVPGVATTAWFLARNTSNFTENGTDWAKCNELCGVRHAYMHSRLYVETNAKFTAWARKQYAAEKANGLLKALPPYSDVYYPVANANWPTAPQDQSP